MEITQIGIGVIAGILCGAFGIWFFDRRHQREVAKLVGSRKKIERQRTQAVHDLFALRAEVEDPQYRPPNASPEYGQADAPDAKLVAELANLRSLIARADGALTGARRKRDENEAEIRHLRSVLEGQGRSAEVIDLRRQGPQQAPPGRSGLAL